jgi:hypothetical protein
VQAVGVFKLDQSESRFVEAHAAVADTTHG